MQFCSGINDPNKGVQLSYFNDDSGEWVQIAYFTDTIYYAVSDNYWYVCLHTLLNYRQLTYHMLTSYVIIIVI